MALQENNGGPVGYGQPKKGMRRRLLREEDEQMFGPPEDAQQFGNGQPPQVYPQQPPGIPSGWQSQPGGYNSFEAPPARTYQGPQGNQGYGGAGGGENQYARQSYQTRTDDPFVAQLRNTMATPLDAGQTPGVPGGWKPGQPGQNGGIYPQSPNPQGYQSTGDGPFGAGARRSLQEAQQLWDQEYNSLPPGGVMNRQRPGTEGSVDPRFSTPESGYGYGGAQNPQYTSAPQVPGAPGGGDFASRVQQANQNGYTDIQGMRDQFKPGQFMDQLAGFNTQSWGTGERGSDTLKNMLGTIFSNHDVTQPNALQRALPDIQRGLPGASIVEHPNGDMLDPDGPNGPMQPVDVIQSAVAGGSGAKWQWQPQDQQQQQTGPQGPSAQAYWGGMPQAPGSSTPTPLNSSGVPQVQDQNSAQAFLEWLMQQQQQGALPQY